MNRSILKKPSPLRAIHPDSVNEPSRDTGTSGTEISADSDITKCASNDEDDGNDPELQGDSRREAAIKNFQKKHLKPVDSIRVTTDRLSSSPKSRFLKRRKHSDTHSPRMLLNKDSDPLTAFPFPGPAVSSSSFSDDVSRGRSVSAVDTIVPMDIREGGNDARTNVGHHSSSNSTHLVSQTPLTSENSVVRTKEYVSRRRSKSTGSDTNIFVTAYQPVPKYEMSLPSSQNTEVLADSIPIPRGQQNSAETADVIKLEHRNSDRKWSSEMSNESGVAAAFQGKRSEELPQGVVLPWDEEEGSLV